MAKLSRVLTISLDGRKPILIPDDLLVSNEHGDFLKFRASSPKLLQLLCGLPKKNSSLTDSSLLQGLKDKRDSALEQLLNPEETADNMGLGLGNTKAKAKKVQQNAQHMVSIDVDGVPVSVLCPCFRTGQADLQVLVDENMLTAVFHHLLPDCENKVASPKAKKKGTKRQREESPVPSPEGPQQD